MTTAVEPRERMIEARGLRFHYVEWGEPDAPPMLLLHGLSSMGRIWDPLARAFVDGYRLIALDQRGHGDTSWPDESAYATEDYLGDLEALIDTWGLDGFPVIGLSMGGHNAMAYAVQHSDRLSHLVVVDIRATIAFEKRPSLDVDKHVAENGHFTHEDHEAALRAARLTNQTTPDEALRHRLRFLLKQVPDGRWVNKHDPRVSYYWRPADLAPALGKVSVPTLIVRGGKSNVLSAGAADRLRDRFPRAEAVTIEEAGHTVPEDTPGQFIETVRSFLERY